jgi:protocatechuate 3,4-dioxygenase beta subunit
MSEDNPVDHDHHHDDHHDDHREGLLHDLPGLVARGEHGLGRRGVLGILGGLGAAAGLAACGPTDNYEDVSSTSTPTASNPTSAATAATSTGVNASDGEIPEETGGPYPGDGSNGANVLTESGVVRSDITHSFGTGSGVAEGVPLTIRLKVYDLNGTDVTPYAGAAVYVWHCDRDGNYSMYSSGVEGENYLRGVQEAAADGTVEFTSIFPAAYSGRWPHVHFEVYPSLDDATSASNKLRTTQLALPQDACETVYANADGYEASVANLAQTSLSTDMVFSDGYSLQLANVTGSIDTGYVATLNVPV